MKLTPSNESTTTCGGSSTSVSARTRSSSACEVAKNRPPSSRRVTTPGGASTTGIGGLVETLMSQSSERATPITTPASTPEDSTATIAATAIQKSKRATRRSRRSSGRSIIPNTTASMITAPRTAFGRSEKSGARKSSVSSTSAPVISDAIGVRAPADSFSELADRLVETGIPWNTPAPAFAIPCATDSWSTSIRYLCRAANARASPAVCEKPISTSANAAIAIVAAWSPISERAGISGAGSPLGTSPTSATPCASRSNSRAPRMPPATSTSAPGTAGARKRRPRITASDSTPTSSVVPCTSPSEPIHDPSSRHEFFPSASVPVSFGSSPITTSTAAPARKPVTTALERKCEIQPRRSSAMARNSSPVAIAIAATSSAASSPASPATTTAPPATAASEELGPVEIWRDVQKSA